MATQTPNLNLTKPAGTDYVRIGDFNDNADKLDVSIGDLGQLTTDAKANLVLAINEAMLRGGENAPFIDVDTLHWMMWDVETAQYVDSGVKAEGADGSDGADGISAFVWIKWSAIQPTQNSDMKDTPDQFIGVYSGTSPTAPAAYTSYQWYKYKGEKGDKGDAGVTVTVGTTTTGAAGTQASVSNSGTASDAVLNFTIPQGATGAGVPDGGTDGQIIVKSGVSAVWQDQNTVDGIAAIDGNIPLSAARQYSTMPTVTTADNGTIAQYIGTDETTYKTGHWYEVVNGAWQEIVYGDPNSVSYDAQDKTDAQKAQARTNVGAADVTAFSAHYTNGVVDGLGLGTPATGSGNVDVADTLNSSLRIAIGAASNANLFINWDWRNPVNQRAATTWSMHSFGIDRWKFQSVSDDGGMTVNVGYVTVSAGSYNEGAYTRVEQNIIETGKTYTVSLLLHDGSVLSAQVVAPAKDGTVVLSSFGSASWNCGMLFDNGAWSVYPALMLDNASASLDIDAVKLELGSVSTLLSDAPPDYAEELLKCQMYYQLRSLGDIAASDMRPMMRLANPTVTSAANGYAYSAEL